LIAAPERASAQPRPLTKAEKKVIGKRLAPVVNYRRAIALERGETLFVVRRVKVERGKIRGGVSNYEGVITGFRGPRGLLVDPRIDQVKFKPKGKSIEVTFRYAVMAMPGVNNGGRIFFTLKLIERAGIGASVVSVPLNHKVKIKRPKPSAVDLTADFYGYRVYKKLAREKLTELRNKGIDGLRLDEAAELPAQIGTPKKLLADVLNFDKWRRRTFIARRHLAAAVKARDRSVAALARKYLRLIDAPDSKIADLPAIPLVEGAAPMAAGKVETLEPEVATAPRKKEPTPPPPRKTKPKKTDGVVELQPLGPADSKPKPVDPRRREREPEPEVEEKPEPVAVTPESTMEPADVEAIEELRRRQGTPIDSHPRFLTLEDSNIGFSFATRFAYATMSRPENALVLTWLGIGQISLWRDIGLELTTGLAYVDAEIPRTEPIVQGGNILAALKYRLHLPEVLAGRPELTFRLRYTIPVSPPQDIQPGGLPSDVYYRPANYSDLNTFLIDKHGPGGGFGTSWRFGIAHLGAQLHGDYYLAVGAAREQLEFFSLAWGASVGVLPLDDLLGVYAEVKGATTFVGPNRTEVQGYLGARVRPTELFEFGVWASLPFGSILAVSGIQFGAELRVVYDVDSLELAGAGRRSGEFEFD